MSGKPFVDTNVLVYAATENDARSEPARALQATVFPGEGAVVTGVGKPSQSTGRKISN
jgi:hypothetical protein